MLLHTRLELEDPDYSSADLICHRSIKVSFANLMRFHHRARWCLMKSRAYMGTSEISHATILCSLCKRDCYVAYLNCDCNSHPVCLRHEIKSLDFPCGDNRTLLLREDVSAMEVAAKKFEQEVNVLCEVQQRCRIGDDLFLLSSIFPRAEEDGYTPYCEINFDHNPEITKTEDKFILTRCSSHSQPILSSSKENFRREASDASLSSAASTVCSFAEPAEIFSIADNVQGHSNHSVENLSSTKSSKEVSRHAFGSSTSTVADGCLATHQFNLQGSEVKPVVNQDSDESDSEIFRVKRRSSMKAERRYNVSICESFDHQGLKRLKKLQHGGRCGQSLSSECSTTDNVRGNTEPISVKFKKTANDEAASKHRDDSSHTGKTSREPPPIDIGPKRLKVRGPSYLGSDSKLD